MQSRTAKFFTAPADVSGSNVHEYQPVLIDIKRRLVTAARRLTALNLTTSDTPAVPELARDGSLKISADLYDTIHQTHLVVAGAFVRTPLAIPCDGLWTDSDGYVVYYQPRGRPHLVEDGFTFATPAKWGGATWVVAAAKATHAAGVADALTATEDTSRPLVIGKRYAVVMKISGRTAGTATPYLGTQAGTARAADGTYIEVITVAGNTGVSVVPSADFDGAVELLQVYPRSPKLAAKSYAPFAATEIVGIAAGTALGTLVAASDTVEVHACYRRVPGATDLG